MIRVCIDMDACTLDMDGHADYGDVGQDIVCAAASMLAYTLIERARELTNNIYAHAESGRLHLHADPDLDSCILLRSAFETVRAGFDLLERRYPGHVQVQRGDYMSPPVPDIIRA